MRWLLVGAVLLGAACSYTPSPEAMGGIGERNMGGGVYCYAWQLSGRPTLACVYAPERGR